MLEKASKSMLFLDYPVIFTSKLFFFFHLFQVINKKVHVTAFYISAGIVNETNQVLRQKQEV